MREETYIVKIQRPDGVTISEMEGYIEDAIRQEKKHYPPDEDICELDDDSVLVRRGTYIRLRKAADSTYAPIKTIIKHF